MQKIVQKTKEHKNALFKLLIGAVASIILLGTGFGLSYIILPKPNEDEEKNTALETNATIELPETIKSSYTTDKGEVVEIETYPFVESVDGGQFLDEGTAIIKLEDGQYAELGAIELVDTSSVENFKKDTLGRCIIANNLYGAQCVSLARAFWFSYAGRDVSTCGTGVAKGMMNCYQENAGDDFQTIWSVDDIISGTWIITEGSYTGHICMTLSKPQNGYVACLGENQGGAICGQNVGGSATNIINLSTKNFIGGYIPKSYIPKTEPLPEKLPETSH